MSLKIYPIGRVYQIVNDVDDLKYVGSTGRTLAQRMSEHRRKSKKGTEGRKRSLYMHMRAIGVEHFNIILLEQTGPATKEALRARENIQMVAMDTVKNGLNGRYESQFCIHNRDVMAHRFVSTKKNDHIARIVEGVKFVNMQGSEILVEIAMVH